MMFARDDLSRKMMLLALTAKTATKNDLLVMIKQLKIAVKYMDELNENDGYSIAGKIKDMVSAPYYLLDLPTFGKMCKELSISEQTVRRRLIETKYGGFKNLLIEIRTDSSKDLLLTTNKSAKEVGMLCGFSDTPTFYRWFKINMGMTPKEFREANNKLLGHEYV